MPADDASFAVIALLGAVHGINPAMGWLFALSLGLQERRRGAVWRAIVPLTLGHALAIAATLLGAAVLGLVMPLAWLRWAACGALLVAGVLHLRRHRHPRGGGMRVGARDLTIWSFLMASAHGAGLMVLPFVLRLSAPDAGTATMHAHAGHLDMAGMSAAGTAGILATLLHTAAYVIVAGAIAAVFYEKLGLRLLRTAWINLDLIWAIALIVTAMLTPLM